MIVKTVYFEINNRCNLNCATCYNRSGINKTYSEISAVQLQNSIEIFLKHGLERVLISGGEPVLHSDFDGILELVEKYPEISFGISTNGTVYNQKLIDMLNQTDNFTLQISLDGSTEEYNAKTRGKNNYAKTIKFAKQIHKQNPGALLKMVISRNNIADVENFYRLAISLGFTPEYAFITRRGNAGDKWDDLCVSPKQKFNVLKQIDGLNKEYGIEAFLPLCTTGCPYAHDENKKKLSLCITPDGTIHPCSLLYDSKYSLGNIFEFDENYFVERIAYISGLAVKRESADYDCQKCVLQNNCKRGCIAEAFILNGDIFANDGECDFRKMQVIGFDLRNLQKNKHE